MQFQKIYKQLLRQYGHQKWWPADSPFEMMIGAILTQNTAWTNVERAIENLKAVDCLDADRILRLDEGDLAECLRPSGYFNIKAKRLRNYCLWYLDQGGFDVLSQWDDASLRRGLLSVNGVGPETADDILLYAFERPVFVVDAYTKRLFSRLGCMDEDLTYHQVQALFHQELPQDVALFNEYHALIVMHCKDVCKKRPVCDACCMKASCPSSGFC